MRQREERARLLASPVRAEIMRHIRSRPGMGMRELADAVGLDWSSLSYHLERLEEAKLVATTLAGRRRLVYPSVLPSSEDAAARSALMESTTRRVALAILARPGTSVVDLVEELGETPRVIYHHVKRLTDLGLVEVPAKGSRRGVGPTAKLHTLLSQKR